MKIFFDFFVFFFVYSLIDCKQPYFPEQIVFSLYNGSLIYAIDEVNQRAFSWYSHGSAGNESGFVFQHFPYAIPDSPESKNYVQLLIDTILPGPCRYGVYWKYGFINFNEFPEHWGKGESSFKIKNYIDYPHLMIHAESPSQDEDYWHSIKQCEIYTGQVYPCNEIHFKKNTDIPLRSAEVRSSGIYYDRSVYNYEIISIGQPDDKYFSSIPTNWSTACRDVSLGVLYSPQKVTIDLNQSVKVQVWLMTPPHRINGSDIVTIQFSASQFNDSLTWTPNQFTFNSENFDKKQVLTITRVKDSNEIILYPSFIGGGFDLVVPSLYPLHIR